MISVLLSFLFASVPTDVDGGTWFPRRLDLKLALWPEQKELAIEATLALRLAAAGSRGPTIHINAVGIGPGADGSRRNGCPGMCRRAAHAAPQGVTHRGDRKGDVQAVPVFSHDVDADRTSALDVRG